MDKRTFLAVLLTFVVLIGYQLLYVEPKRRDIAQKRMVEQSIADSLASLEQAASVGDSTAAPEPEEPAETPVQQAQPSFEALEEAAPAEVVVTTNTMRVTLGSIGARVAQVELLEHERAGGGPVLLVPDGEAGGFEISVLRDGRWGGEDAVYTTYIDGRRVDAREEITLFEPERTAVVAFVVRGQSGGFIEKRFTFSADGYEVGLDVKLRREGWLRESEAYAVGWECGMARNEKDERRDLTEFAALGLVGEERYKELARKFSKGSEKLHEGTVVWAGSRTKYFLSALLPREPRSSVLALFGDKETSHTGYAVRYSFRGDPRVVEDSFACYLGPLDMEGLKAYGVGLEQTIELGKLRFLSVLALRFMLALERFIPNYGLIIIILSILTKVLFYRLTHKSFKSMKDMQKLQPKIKELQEKYKDDKEKMNKAMMNLYKEAGVNPLGGCLPLLLQMPVFIALFNVLRNTIELRNAPFMLWISDLSSPDVLFSFGASIPFIGSEFHLLPILMGGLMVLQSKLGASPTGEAAPPGQTKMMTTMMPIVLTFVFYGMPSGLVLYWIVNNILTIAQQYYVHRQVEKEEMVAAQKSGAAKSGKGRTRADEATVFIDKSDDIKQ